MHTPSRGWILGLFVFSICLLFAPLDVTAQDDKLAKKVQKREEKEKKKQGYIGTAVNQNLFADLKGSDDFFFHFDNVNNIPYFYDKGKLNKILTLEKKGNNDAELIRQLEQYVAQFGIKNFSKDTDLIWKLAQLYEKNEEMKKAKAAYRLVLKHHRTSVVQEIQQYFKIREHYDELTELDKDYYVPLDYYYELVEYRQQIDTLHPPRSVMLNMGSEINSRRVADYGPSISKRDDFILFTKKTYDVSFEGIKSKFNEDLYFSKMEDGLWYDAEPFPAPINSSCNEGSACLSKDGRTIYFTRCRVPECKFDCFDCLGDCDIFTSHLDREGNWSQPLNLGASVNSKDWESHPTLSPSEDTLYFASDRIDGFGLSDIWYTTQVGKDRWAPAKNMGPTINSRNNEASPFFSKEEGVFYFSSNGQVFNFDDVDHTKKTRTLDIYKVYRKGKHWMEPKNIGPLVNGSGDEFYFTIDRDAQNLYYAKTEENSEDHFITDLFSFPVPMGAQPRATVTLKGTLIDEETGNPYEGIVSVIDLDNGIEVAPKNIRPDGTYEFDLIDQNNYLLVIQGDEFFRIEKLFYMDGDQEVTTEAKNIAGKKLQFSSVVFENGKWDILGEMEKDLWDVVNFLVDNPEFELTIGGHTDGDGNANSNLLLSQKRADAIKEFIVKQGYIDPNRVTAIGYGSTKPIREEVTDEDKATNRRVEFEIAVMEDAKQDNPFGDDDEEEEDDGW